MSATVSSPAAWALEPSRVGSAELTLTQRRVPPSSAFCSATACPVVPLPAKKSSTSASSGIVPRIRRTSPVGLGDSKTWPTISLSSATAVSVEPTSSASQIVRSFLRRPPGCRGAASRVGRRRPARRAPLHPPADQVVAALVDQRPAPPPHRRRPVAEDRPDLDRAVERRRAHPPGLRVAPDREVQGPRGHRVELLVGVAQRQVPVPPAVVGDQREVALDRRCPGCSRPGRYGGRRGRRRAGTRGWSRTRCPSWRPFGLRLTTTWARKFSSPNTSSISSRRCATSLSSMLTKIAPRSASTSRAASSRGRIIATQAWCRAGGRRPRGCRRGRRSRCRCCTAGRCRSGRPVAETGAERGQHVEVVALDEGVPRPAHDATLVGPVAADADPTPRAPPGRARFVDLASGRCVASLAGCRPGCVHPRRCRARPRR